MKIFKSRKIAGIYRRVISTRSGWSDFFEFLLNFYFRLYNGRAAVAARVESGLKV